jgi:hypothetical protein
MLWHVWRLVSAHVVREIIILTARYLLPKEKLDVPVLDWFTALRESLGVEADLYTYMKIAAAQDILQLGFDETEISGQSTLNIWVKIQTSMNTTIKKLLLLVLWLRVVATPLTTLILSLSVLKLLNSLNVIATESKHLSHKMIQS